MTTEHTPDPPPSPRRPRAPRAGTTPTDVLSLALEARAAAEALEAAERAPLEGPTRINLEHALERAEVELQSAENMAKPGSVHYGKIDMARARANVERRRADLAAHDERAATRRARIEALREALADAARRLEAARAAQPTAPAPEAPQVAASDIDPKLAEALAAAEREHAARAAARDEVGARLAAADEAVTRAEESYVTTPSDDAWSRVQDAKAARDRLALDSRHAAECAAQAFAALEGAQRAVGAAQVAALAQVASVAAFHESVAADLAAFAARAHELATLLARLQAAAEHQRMAVAETHAAARRFNVRATVDPPLPPGVASALARRVVHEARQLRADVGTPAGPEVDCRPAPPDGAEAPDRVALLRAAARAAVAT